MIVDTLPYRCALETVAPIAVCIHHAGDDSGVFGSYVIAFSGIADQIVELGWLEGGKNQLPVPISHGTADWHQAPEQLLVGARILHFTLKIGQQVYAIINDGYFFAA